MHLSHASIILIIAVAGNVTSITFVAFALSATNSSNHEQHLATNRQLADIERHASIIREGDAKILPDFRINRDFVDSDDSCDFCTQVNYTPSVKGRGAIAYQFDTVDLSSSTRLVFFARGQNGSEEITFVGVGNPQINSTESGKMHKVDLFPDQSFGFKTQEVTLSKQWKRYIIDLDGLDLKRVSYPFGLITGSNISSGGEIFYLKGVTFDSKNPVNPMKLVPINP